MRVILRSSSLLFGLVGIALEAQILRAPRDYHLAHGRAGRAKLGMTADEVRRWYPPESTRFDGSSLEIRVIPADTQPDIIAEIENGRVVRLRVLSPRFRTEKDIGVGATESELRKAYPVRWNQHGKVVCARIQGLEICCELAGLGGNATISAMILEKEIGGRG